MKNITIATHSAPFHADDLVATALLIRYFSSLNHPIQIIHTRDQNTIKNADAVVDVGREHNPQTLRFDHHQIKESTKAASGLVADFLESLPTFEWIQSLRESLNKIDRADLGKIKNPEDTQIARALGAFNTTWKETEKDPTTAFFEALQVVNQTLDLAQNLQIESPTKSLSELFEKSLFEHPAVVARQNQSLEMQKEGEELFLQAAEQMAQQKKPTGIVETIGGIPFAPLFKEENLKNQTPLRQAALKRTHYITFRGLQGGFNAVAAASPEDSFKPKHPFPERWRGKGGQNLLNAISLSTGKSLNPCPPESSNLYFCHPGGFFLTTPEKDSFETALKYCTEIPQRKEKTQTQERL